ncbi:MAG: 40S ribosomal protein SA [Amphiamblys sp. WSBS2006]|nr:MAG: 40S ribosomal protein SA [Amphiamblys sp. WSBS2006]
MSTVNFVETISVDMPNRKPVPKVDAEDARMMLAASCHLGSQNVTSEMERYVWQKRGDGVHIINIEKTWKKIQLAAKIIASIDNPEDICVLASRPYAQKAAHKFASFLGAQAVVGRFTPGTFTNYITSTFREPRLVVVADSHADQRAILEASYGNIPCISLCDIDADLRGIDCAIPANNRGKHAIGTVFYLLVREVLRLRQAISRTAPWDIMVDLFFYRDPEDIAEDEGGLPAQE